MFKIILKSFTFLTFVFFCHILNTYASTKYVQLTNAVYIRSGPATTYSYYILGNNGSTYNLKRETVIPDEANNGKCNAGWYEVDYNDVSGYICASYATIKDPNNISDEYERPWTSPKKAIIGGAKYISKYYISKGQFNSYLKKFNVNPNSAYKVYSHQYMANLAAPYSESYTSFRSYRDNGLLNLPLEFTIPIFLNMPEYTALPTQSANLTCQSEVTDQAFEALLDAEGFPESYKCKLRLLHNVYPNWTFKSLQTGLDFYNSVIAEQAVSSIQGGDKYYDLSSGNRVQTEPGWYRANYDTVAYYLDPRNFLVVERILMFENLSYSANYTEDVVISILKGSFMEGFSSLDNQNYSSIFVEAGITANMSAVYLASLAIQEAGTKVTNTTSGAEFTYKGVTYKGLFNFFNIGAFSSEGNPALAGLVWAAGGSSSVIVGSSSSSESTPTITTTETEILAKLGAINNNNHLQNLALGTTIGTIKNTLAGLTVTIDGADTDVLKTGRVITISDGTNTYTYTISIKGDVDGDGLTGATDYVKIKNRIMEKSGSDLNIAQSLAADVDANGAIGATDYVIIKNSIMER